MNVSKSKILKLISILITIVISIIIVIKLYDADESVLVFLSDYQDMDIKDNKDYENINIKSNKKQKNLKSILSSIYKNETNVELVAYLGDYQEWPLVEKKSLHGIMEAKKITYDIFGYVDTIFISGNHDYEDFKNEPYYFNSSGLYEYSNYSLYLINYNDYSHVDDLLDNLDDLLEKANKNKPLIILSHMPLHWSVRKDNYYSYDIFKIINNYALHNDVVYLFGHNHSRGFDNDIGGSIVYKEIGDSIKIKYPDKKVVDEKLNFTYMNAGYVGYYNEDTKGLDFTYDENYDTNETISVFKINKNKIKIKRYSKEGIYKEYVIKLKN